MNRLRLVAVGAGISSAIALWAWVGSPTQAAQQSAVAGAETSSPVKQDARAEIAPGAKEYAKECAVCHGDEREGNLPAFPPLEGIAHRLTNDQIAGLVHGGKGRMPAFPHLQGAALGDLLQYLQTPAKLAAGKSAGPVESGQVAAGDGLFHQNCAFCHGRDAQGGESGPDLTQSKLVLGDKTGELVDKVVRNGRPETKMPGFNFSNAELESLVAFLRFRVKAAAEHPGGRRGVSVADLQTGNVDAGRRYFEGAGGCAKCHSASGDLHGIASRYEGLALEERMLYPRSRAKLTVTLDSGEQLTGWLAYRDEFVVGMHDEHGVYRSWQTGRVKYAIDDPVQAHVAQFPKYTDENVRDLMAYLQTLK